MLVLITYDVNTEDPAGRRRLRQIAQQCGISRCYVSRIEKRAIEKLKAGFL